VPAATRERQLRVQRSARGLPEPADDVAGLVRASDPAIHVDLVELLVQRLSAVARKFADVFGLGGLGGGLVESLGEAVEISAGELPLERLGDLLVAATERE
jgi:hypothetical protein